MKKKGTVEKIINGGWGLVRSDEGVVFVNYVLPGENITYSIKEKAKGILWGHLEEVLTPSQYRVKPPCPYYGQCGGCVFQHIDFQYQETIKKEILMDDLKRIGNHHAPLPPIFQSPPFNNRTRARMKGQEDGKIGFIRKGTNTVLPIAHCLLFPDEINRFIRRWNALDNPPFFFELEILHNPDNNKVYVHLSHPPKDEKLMLQHFPDVTFSWKGNEDAAVSQLKIKEATYRVSPAVFFQVNPHQWENMLNTVESYLHPCGTILDLYSGVGFFIPSLKQYAEQVIAVESFGFSSTLAKRQFDGPGIDLRKQPVEKFRFSDADIVVVDPPRSGLSKHVIQQILRKQYKDLVYISCSAATFSRDLKILRENNYHLDKINVFDLFPQTAHLETISHFKHL
jgi:23S rRNA (uracil1939-C5)-methyltransferase